MKLKDMKHLSFESFCGAKGYNFIDWLYYLGRDHGVDYVEMHMYNTVQLSNVYRERTRFKKAKDFGDMAIHQLRMTKEEYKYWKKVSRHWILYLEINDARNQDWDRTKLNPIELFEIDIIAQATNNTRKNMGQASGFDESMV